VRGRNIVVKDDEGKHYYIPPNSRKDFYIETVLRYKTSDGYTGSIVKIRSKKDK